MSFFSLHHLIQLLHAYGNVVLGVAVGLESVGLPLPGETLLIAAAVLAGTTYQMNILFVVLSAALGAIIGQAVGYGIGWGVGFRLLRRYGRYIGLTDRRLAYGRALFRRHGVKVVFASRFIVLLRTWRRCWRARTACRGAASWRPTLRAASPGPHFTASVLICWATRRSKSPGRSPSVSE